MKKIEKIDCKLLLEYSKIREILNNTVLFGTEYFEQVYNLTFANFNLNPIWEKVTVPYLNGQIDTKSALILMDEHLYFFIRENIENKNIIEWDLFLTYLGRKEIFKIIEIFQLEMSDKDYWTFVGFSFTSGYIHVNEYDYILSFFLSERPSRK
ncbi:hypothetical protein RCH18_002983 [Flavobacterium sp. PL11]|uniref:hypothetical protein n=1 Tax=Flavobacterium sp. PL11 TaxID=3071717 RepID=UPI002E0A78E0|nr:hypothetical protein [Flavobacterium sp. PL11]